MARVMLVLLLALPGILLFAIGGFDVEGAVEHILFVLMVAVYSVGSVAIANALLETRSG